MVFDRDPDVAADPGGAPHALAHPADVPPPLGHVRDSEAVQSFRSAWATHGERARSSSLPARLRAWAGRVTGRSDRYLLSTVARATDAVAAHCDALTDRLSAQEAITADVTAAFGQELAQLRAEVQHLRRVVGTPSDAAGSGP
ncbi:MAG TPA: hypothetical protein VHS57_06370 [Acidimicrobiales bacterium]|nr:hypothetical protein [Acidimicrobiales bacterium]